MREIGHITLWNVECVCALDSNEIIIIPKEKEDIQKLNKHFNDCDFIVNYHSRIGESSAFIERVEIGIGGVIKLMTKYSVEQYHTNVFSGFEITGKVIDDFFKPSRYFYDRLKENVDTNVDFIYHSEVADKWEIVFENKLITVTLSYGDILRRGIGSDLMLHPKLTVDFGQTSDITYIYRVYSFVLRFLKIIRYDIKCGELRIELFCSEQGKKSYNGYLYDFNENKNQFQLSRNEVEYGNYKPYIRQFLQFSADNPQYNFFHYPTGGMRWRGRHYSAVDFLNIFSAFESECHANQELYEKTDTSKIQSIKESLIMLVDKYPNNDLLEEEQEFLNTARNNLMKQGTEFGQRKKIKKAYNILQKALNNSIENIFFLPEFKCRGKLTNKKLNEVVEFLAGERGAIAHGRFSGVFSDVDAQKIHFLEILVYAQMLKRIGLEDNDIERVIGVLFGCNYVVFQEKY